MRTILTKQQADFLEYKAKKILNKTLLKDLDIHFYDVKVKLNLSSIAVKLVNAGKF